MDDDELLFQGFMWLLALDEHLCRDRASARKSSLIDIKKIDINVLRKMKPHTCLPKLFKNLELIILLPAPLSTSAFTVHSSILSVTLGGSKLVLTHLIYCRGLGQVPPSGPTASPVVTSFPQTRLGPEEVDVPMLCPAGGGGLGFLFIGHPMYARCPF
jgi:hypothetical protein